MQRYENTVKRVLFFSVFLCIICKLGEKFLLLQRTYEQEDSNIRRIVAALLQIEPHATDSGSDVFGSLRRKRGQCSRVAGHDGRRRGVCDEAAKEPDWAGSQYETAGIRRRDAQYALGRRPYGHVLL